MKDLVKRVKIPEPEKQIQWYLEVGTFVKLMIFGIHYSKVIWTRRI